MRNPSLRVCPLKTYSKLLKYVNVFLLKVIFKIRQDNFMNLD